MFALLGKFAPIILSIARQGQAAWEAWIDARAADGDAALTAGFAKLRSENIRMLIIAEAEAEGK